eukprot:6687836-Pyramimonas_sp.AAC.1
MVVCSHYSDAVDVVKALRRKGIHATAARSCVYLGADLGAGRRHAREQRVKRVVKHVARHKQVRKYTVTLRKAKISSSLEKQGGQAVRTKGRCLTSLLAIRSPEYDPAQKFAHGTFALWLQQWRDHPEIRPAVERAWAKIVDKLQGVPAAQRSRHVRGPLSAIITYLLSFGWVPRGPTDWVLPAADHDWRFPADGFSEVKALDNF